MRHGEVCIEVFADRMKSYLCNKVDEFVKHTRNGSISGDELGTKSMKLWKILFASWLHTKRGG